MGVQAVRVQAGELTLEVSHCGRDGEYRQVYRYLIRRGGRFVEGADDLRSGVGAEVDVEGAMNTLVAFLTTAAEQYRRTMGVDVSDYVMSVTTVAEAAYANAAELEALACDHDEARR